MRERGKSELDADNYVWVNNSHRLTHNKAISKVLVVGLAIIVCVVVGAGAYYGSLKLNSPQPPKPNLKIASLLVSPDPPQAGVAFNAQVFVENIGEAESGSYDLTVWIHDTARDSNYTLGTHRLDPVSPGERYCAWSDSVSVNLTGFHQLWAEITPLLFEDVDDRNNVSSWQFEVIY